MRWRGRARRRFRGERGETLAETLVTVILMGTGVVGILAGLTAAITASDANTDRVTAETVLHDYAEAIIAAEYTECTPGYPAATVGFAPPSGFTAESTGVAFYDGTSTSPAVYGGPPGTCGGAPPRDQGAQRIQLRVTSTQDANITRTLEIVKRRP